MINELSPEKIASIPAFVKAEVEKVLAESKCTDEEIEKKWQTIYEECGLQKPRVIVCRDGIDEFVKTVLKWNKESQVGSQVWSQVWTVRSQVRSQVGSQVRSQVGTVGSQVRSQVGSQVWSQVWTVRSQVGSQVGSQVWSQVGSQVWIVRSQVESQSYYWANDIVFNKFFFDVCSLTEESKKNLLKYEELINDSALTFFTEEVCVVLIKPKVRQNNGLTHSDTAPAIEWKKDKFYYLNGVSFPEELWKKVTSKKMPFSEIMAIVDVDQRTQAMKYGDFHEFAAFQNAKKLDSYTKLDINGNEVNYELWQFPKGELFQKDVHFMWYECPSTRNEYTSGVWESKTVAEAMARKQGITEELWKRQVPLLHES